MVGLLAFSRGNLLLLGCVYLGTHSTGCASRQHAKPAAPTMWSEDQLGFDPMDCPALDAMDRATPEPASRTPDQRQLADAYDLVATAVGMMDAGNLDAAHVWLRQAARVAPDDPVVGYETAFAYYLGSQWDKVIELLAPGTQRFQGQGYQLLGNAVDHHLGPSCAFRIYNEGLHRFRHYGGLYLELGVLIARHQGPIETALAFWETGIHYSPDYASNYFHAAQVLAQSSEPIWALLYGEAFMNLAPNDARGQQLGRVLWMLYSHGVTPEIRADGTTEYVSLFVAGSANQGPTPATTPDVELQFPQAWTAAMTTPLAAEVAKLPREATPEMSLAALHTARTGFIHRWLKQYPQRPASHPLIERQIRVFQAGHLKAYNYWLFRTARANEYAEYISNNAAEAEAFASWRQKNPFRVPSHSSLSRGEHALRREKTTQPDAVSPHQALSAIREFADAPLGKRASRACKKIIRFAEQNEQVTLMISDNTMPWLLETASTEQGEYAAVLLTCAYFAGTIKAQLKSDGTSSAPQEGLHLALDVYRRMKQADRLLKLPSLEHLQQLRSSGRLREFIATERTSHATQ